MHEGLCQSPHGNEQRPPIYRNFNTSVNEFGGDKQNVYQSSVRPHTITNLQDVDVPDDTYLTDYLTDEVVRLIETHDESQPFFLNLWYYTVHTPIQAKQEKIEKYEAKAKAMGLDRVQTFEEGDFFPAEHKKHLRIQRRLVQSDPVYAAMIESLDENIGKLVDALERTGQIDNTIFFFTSDFAK